MMSRVLHASIALTLLALVVAILIYGLRARRTRTLALFGFVPAGAATGAIAWSWLHPEADLVARTALGLTAVSLGLAHVVAASIAALPPRAVWLRMVFLPFGLWTGTLAGLWLLMPQAGKVLELSLALFLVATIAGWIAILTLGRDRGQVVRGGTRSASVRFACPRCGTRVDWISGAGTCTDCGLFVHLAWPADELQEQRAKEGATAGPSHGGSVRFACPSCGRKAVWPVGHDACAGCGLKLSIYWNEHTRPAAP
jgi:hypothetical protein